jgi:hypothetical protein
MDVPKSKNVYEEDFNPSASTTSTQDVQKIGVRVSRQQDEPQKIHIRVRLCIILILLGLFAFIIVYGLLKQNYFLVGVLCGPVIVRGVYRIIDRYLPRGD